MISANITRYLNEQFAFDNTTVVKTETDQREKTITVSLVGNTIAPDVIEKLESSLSDYGLEDFSLKVTQNSAIIPDGENAERDRQALPAEMRPEPADGDDSGADGKRDERAPRPRH